MRLLLEYKRLSKEVDGVYPYTGKFSYSCLEENFIGWDFKKLVNKLSDTLNAHADIDSVVFQRTDREGIMPMSLGPATIDLLRKDPLSAYRAMNFNTSGFLTDKDKGYNKLSRTFGPVVYVKMASGRIQCPVTGEWKSLAYGVKTGWKIRGEGNNHDKWVPLLGVVDTAPDGANVLERIAFCHWAQVDVRALLDTGHDKYYLPRAWNEWGSWIDRDSLEQLLKEFGDTTCQK